MLGYLTSNLKGTRCIEPNGWQCIVIVYLPIVPMLSLDIVIMEFYTPSICKNKYILSVHKLTNCKKKL